MEWKPATIESVKDIVLDDLTKCNVSAISPDGQVLEQDCNQNDLGSALNLWIESCDL
jgi:hypothetical protein